MSPSARLQQYLSRFARDESGVMIAIAIFFLLIMIAVGGMGVDFMRQELQRSRMQSVLDRAVLAAADKDQLLDPKDVVDDYFRKYDMLSYIDTVTVTGDAGARTVNVTAHQDMPTQFLRTLGFPTLPIPISGEAQEAVGDAEISLVVDISGSMSQSSKMSQLRSAASEFVDTVLGSDDYDKVSLSVVPYTSNVNAGPEIMSRMNVTQVHGYSHCIEFDDDDFSNTTITTTQKYIQGQHFEETSSTRSGIVNPACPMRSYERIQPFSHSTTTLKSNINQLTSRANTAIHLGMKWGVGLLDPAFRPVVTDMVSDGLIDANFLGRPMEYGESSKNVILMTDGENVNTIRLRPEVYATPDMVYHWGYRSFYETIYDAYSNLRSQFYYTRYTSTQADNLLEDICDAAKDNGIVVWTIGFEVGNHGAEVMRNCASSDSHFFRVDGIEISTAFRTIATQLVTLKLTQ
ncbi:TadE/TadG family type IV pilus assembly protein [Pseudooceanicola nanhaiensis]|uniref:TadE/TadG family type IV pilus assembly protein n=1 Tax=Pseudooceanicola nanhaiensis TaxID=375761 RepID=UPI001CD46B50|nr:TadE/TadG family type IV pilus assembly protein [Pseudooceanicola nanhaiensis]MCA0919710.1 Tad domain-containing protein [Pseudooceanicola nanhaiensis]